MKKTILSVIALAMSMLAFATETAHVQIRLTGVIGQQTDVVNLTEDDTHTSAYEPGVDIDKTMTQADSKSVLIYGIVDEHRCSDVVSDDLDGLKLGFVTNKVDQNYKLTFINVSGKALKLFDRVTGDLIDITENGEYPFSVEASLLPQYVVDNRFEIGEPAAEICFTYNELDIYGYAGKSLVITEAESGAEIDNVPSLGLKYFKDLGAYKGRLVVSIDGEEYQIDANPDVTTDHP